MIEKIDSKKKKRLIPLNRRYMSRNQGDPPIIEEHYAGIDEFRLCITQNHRE